MRRGRVAIRDAGIVLLVFVTSLLTSVLCLTDLDRPDGYGLLFLLPLVFCAGFIVLSLKTQLYYETVNTITGVVVLIVYYIRMVVTPLAMYLGNYHSVIGNTFHEEYPIAILMVCIECLVILVYLPYRIHRTIHPLSYNEPKNSEDRAQQLRNNRPGRALWFVVLCMAAFMILIMVRDNTVIRSTFLFLIDTKKEYYALSNSQTGVGTLSMYVEIICMMFKVLQVVLPPMVLWYVLNSHIYRGLKYIISFAVFCSVAVVATEDRIDAIFAAMATLITLKCAYGERFNKQFRKWLMLILLVCVFGLSIKAGVVGNGTQNGFDFSSVSAMLSAYFSGIPTVAAGFSMANEVVGTSILRLPIDILNRIPCFGYALGLLTGVSMTDSNQIFNLYIASCVGRNYGQILPTTAVGYEYYFIFFPLAACMMVQLACLFEKKASEQTDIVRLNLFHWITICVAGAPAVASSLLMTAKLSWFLIIYVLLSVCSKKRR